MSREDQVVIEGEREDGSRLRPSDWVERISSTLASFGADHRLVYSTSVKPCMINGKRCLVVAKCLEEINPQAYEFIMEFARSNHLKIQLDRRFDDRALPCVVPG